MRDRKFFKTCNGIVASMVEALPEGTAALKTYLKLLEAAVSLKS